MAQVLANSGKRGGPLQAELANAIDEEIRERFKKGQMKRGVYAELARKYNVSDVTIANRASMIASVIPLESFNEAKISLGTMRDEAIEHAQEMLDQSDMLDTEEKRKNLMILDRMISQKIDFMEKFFIKPKAPENVNVNASVDVNVRIDKLREAYNATRSI